MSSVDNNPHEKPEVVNTTDASRYETLQFEKIEEFQVISLTKDRTTGELLWRHRYSIADKSISHYGRMKDYPRNQFRNLKAFKKYIQDKDPYEGQKFAWGAYRAAKKDMQPK